MNQILLPVIFGLFAEKKNERGRLSEQTSRPNFILRILLNRLLCNYYFLLLKCRFCTHYFGRIDLKILHCRQVCNFDLPTICHVVHMLFP